MTNRSRRAQIARDTIEIFERGHYTSPGGREVRVGHLLAHAVDNSVLYTPEMFPDLFARRDAMDQRADSPPPAMEVVNQTTLAAARERWARPGDQPRSGLSESEPFCLNFASAKNPGGGFLNGSSAQEESLARSSGLYPCVNQMQPMYERNRAHRSCLYTDYMIYSPQVPVIRDDEGVLLDEPYCVSFLTAPAVNAGAVRNHEPQNADQIAPTMIRRMEQLLSVAVVQGHEHLILGAWGCGVFKNSPTDVAQWFHDLLASRTFRKRFATVVFAVTDGSAERPFIGPFEKRFGGG